MSTPTPSRHLIDTAPALEAPRYGLASVLQGPTTGDGRWQVAGVTYDSDNCAQAGSVDGLCPVITPPDPVTQTASVVFTPAAVTPPALAANLTYSSTPTAAQEAAVTLDAGPDPADGGLWRLTLSVAADAEFPVQFVSTGVTPAFDHTIEPGGAPVNVDGLTPQNVVVQFRSTLGTLTPSSYGLSDMANAPSDLPAVNRTLRAPVSTSTLTVASAAGSTAPLSITVGGTAHTVAPGGTASWDAVADGAVTAAYTSTAGTPTPASSNLTLPLASPATRDIAVQPADTYTVTAASPAASEFAVGFASTPAGITGTRTPGQSAVAATGLTAGTYAIRLTSPAGATGDPVDLVLPGSAVTLAAEQEVTPPPGPDDSSHYKPKSEGLNIVDGYDPFTVYHRFECNPVGMGDNPRQTALDRLALAEWREVEAKHWEQMRTDPDLVALNPLDSPTDLIEAVGTLEARSLMVYNGRPTLHFPRWTQPYLSRFNLIADRDGDGVMRTEAGTRVAFYTGVTEFPSPPAGSFLAFATGTVRAFASAPFVNESFDPPTNTRTFLAERTWALDHDCWLAGIRISVVGLG